MGSCMAGENGDTADYWTEYYTECSLLTLQESWDFLQLQCALYINSETSGIPLSMAVSGKVFIQYVHRVYSTKVYFYVSNCNYQHSRTV